MVTAELSEQTSELIFLSPVKFGQMNKYRKIIQNPVQFVECWLLPLKLYLRNFERDLQKQSVMKKKSSDESNKQTINIRLLIQWHKPMPTPHTRQQERKKEMKEKCVQ